MVVKVKKTVRFETRIPQGLGERIAACRAEYKRQGEVINLSATVVDFLEKETRKMERELRKKNNKFLVGQKDLELDN